METLGTLRTVAFHSSKENKDGYIITNINPLVVDFLLDVSVSSKERLKWKDVFMFEEQAFYLIQTLLFTLNAHHDQSVSQKK